MAASSAKSTFIFLDNNRMLQPAREALEKAYQGYRDLVIYSFTASYLKGPTHLVVKMSPLGTMDKISPRPARIPVSQLSQ